MKRRRVLAAALLAATVISVRAHAVTGDTSRSLCFSLVAERSGIPEQLLRAVAKVESNFVPTAIHFDSDGTYDVGVMQINSSHFPELAARNHITEQMLLERPCLNIAVGAMVLGGFIRTYGSTWRAVGSYGAGIGSQKERARLSYANLIARALKKGWHERQVASASVPADQPVKRMLVLE